MVYHTGLQKSKNPHMPRMNPLDPGIWPFYLIWFANFFNFTIHKTEEKEQILATNNEQKTNANSS